ncbi:hypothetical protein [Streptomyces sp. NPDC085540]|uniref:hypothetical protein n=1 Tax=Streptomyces sp. NPDC085540 TaxID=3365730 RepID=UPI0037CDEFAA
MTDHLRAVFDMLGPGPDRPGDPDAWLRLEQEIGRELPADCKSITDAYAPVPLHRHPYLTSGADLYLTSGADLGGTIREDAETCNEWRAWESEVRARTRIPAWSATARRSPSAPPTA